MFWRLMLLCLYRLVLIKHNTTSTQKLILDLTGQLSTQWAILICLKHIYLYIYIYTKLYIYRFKYVVIICLNETLCALSKLNRTTQILKIQSNSIKNMPMCRYVFEIIVIHIIMLKGYLYMLIFMIESLPQISCLSLFAYHISQTLAVCYIETKIKHRPQKSVFISKHIQWYKFLKKYHMN